MIRSAGRRARHVRAPFAGLLGLASLALVALLGCQSAPAPVPHLNGPPAKILVVKDYAMQAVLGRDKQLANKFAGRETYVITTADLSHPAALGLAGDVEPTANFTSYATFAADLAAGRLSGYRAVAYDIEKWGQTPLVEQQDPRYYMLRFSELARAHGLFPILAPARDLVLVQGSVCAKRGGENLSEAYIRCGLAGAVANAGALVVQSQVDQFNVSAFRNFLSAATRQARAANPRVAVLATLATAPLGRTASIYQLVAAARSVARMVQGYSLNIATSGDQTETADALLWSFK